MIDQVDDFVFLDSVQLVGRSWQVRNKIKSNGQEKMLTVPIGVIPHMTETYDCICGISDHTLGTEVAIASAALGAKIIEKHLTLGRGDRGVDAAFSMEPKEFSDMVRQVRNIEKAKGSVTYQLTENQKEGRKFGRSLFVAEDIPKGSIFTRHNIRSVRPADGIATKHVDNIIGRKARYDLKKGMPLSWEMIE